MKKFFLVFFTLISSYSFSQSFGVKGGLNLGKERASASGISLTSKSLVSFMAGFYGEVATANENLFFAPELIFSIDGGKFEFFGTNATDKLSYLSAPLLMKFYPSDKFNIHGGLQLGVLLKAVGEVDGETIEYTDDVNRINISAAFGAEFDLGAANLGARYVLGLSDLSQEDDGNLTLNTIQIYLAVPFN